MAVNYGNVLQDLVGFTARAKKRQSLNLPTVVAVYAFNDSKGEPLMLRGRKKYSFGTRGSFGDTYDGEKIGLFDVQMMSPEYCDVCEETGALCQHRKIKSALSTWDYTNNPSGEKKHYQMEIGVNTPLEEMFVSYRPMPPLAWYVLNSTSENGLSLKYICDVEEKRSGLINHTALFPPLMPDDGEIAGKPIEEIQFYTSDKNWLDVGHAVSNRFANYDSYHPEWQQKIKDIMFSFLNIEDFQQNMLYCMNMPYDDFNVGSVYAHEEDGSFKKQEIILKLKRGFKGMLAHNIERSFKKVADWDGIKNKPRESDFNCDLTNGNWVIMPPRQARQELRFYQPFPIHPYEQYYYDKYKGASWLSGMESMMYSGLFLLPSFYTYEIAMSDKANPPTKEEMSKRPHYGAYITNYSKHPSSTVRFSKWQPNKSYGNYNKSPKRTKKQRGRYMSLEMLKWYVMNEILVPAYKVKKNGKPYYSENYVKALELMVIRLQHKPYYNGILPQYPLNVQLTHDLSDFHYIGER